MVSILVVFLSIPLLWFGYFIGFQVWQAKRTQEDAYFKKTLTQRRALKNIIKKQRPMLMPVANIMAKLLKPKTVPLFHYKGVSGPAAIASEKSYAAAENYPANADDIFIATQMKCGTTWVQQLVFEILHKGQGDLSDSGHRHMYALSPWLETRGSVPIARAPRVGLQQKRIIKTHLPTSLCPYSTEAKYIYVTRHPVSCFASIQDFFELLTGPFCPSKDNLLDWYLSDNMFWGNWAKHVKDWWQWGQEKNNVLFLHFETMKASPEQIVDQLANFLGITLSAEEKSKVLEKSSFDYMQAKEEHFEMAAPNLFSVATGDKNFMKSGSSVRHEGISPEDKERILAFVGHELQGADYITETIYAELKQPK